MILLKEVAIVGCGFVGAYTAFNLSRKNIGVTVYEEHSHIGYPPHCAGLVSITGLKRLGLLEKLKQENIILNYINSATFHTVSGKKFTVQMEKPVAVVLDREKLDLLASALAMDRGATVFLSTKVLKITPNGVLFFRKNGIKKSKKYEIIIDAEGGGRHLIKDFRGVNLKDRLPAYQIDVKISKSPLNMSPNRVEVFLNTPDFFSWAIPLDTSGLFWRFGIASRKYSLKIREILEALARRYMGTYRILRKFGGLVMAGGPIKKFHWGKIAVVGDAAGQTKPTTGGGVVLGGLSSLLLSCIVRGVLEEKLDLFLYDKLWWKLFGSNMKAMLYVRKLYNHLTHAGIDIIAKITPRLLIERIRGDFDFQLDAIIKLLLPITLIR